LPIWFAHGLKLEFSSGLKGLDASSRYHRRARIVCVLRQHEASEDAIFTIGPYTFRPSSKLLLNPKGNKVRLTEKETSILRYLFRAGPKPVSRETMLQEVWGYNSGVTTHTLETHIYRLRQKIEKDAANPEILVTEAGGYKLVP
jgi:DNA-binding response OmpR family regulator